MSAERAPSARAVLERDYELLRELGIGGTAIVYLARNRRTGAEVAIKLIRAAYLEDEEALARFAREARYASRLDHPNVVPVREVVPLGDGGVALIMAHVPGHTLKRLIRDTGPLPVARAERVLRDVSAGLSAAHSMEIIHRDVKPENIFIDESGDALLADFGLARSTAGDTGDSQLTMTGVAIGTPTYMAPEQIDGGEIDARGDVYSLGLVAWEMLTGKRPWDGDSLYALLYHQKHDYLPDVREFRKDVPDVFADVIATAIEKTPEARWQSVNEMIAALDGVIPSRRQAVRPAASDTVRIHRAAIADASANVAPASTPPASQSAPRPRAPTAAEPAAANLAMLKSLADELEGEKARRRRIVPALLAAVILLALGVFGWTALDPRGAEFLKSARSLASRVVSPKNTAAGTAATSDLASSGPVTPPLQTDSSAARLVADSMRADSAARVAANRDGDVRRAAALSGVAAPTRPLPSTTGARAASAAPPDSPATAAPQRVAGSTQVPPSASPTPAAPVAPPTAAPVATRATIFAGGMHTCLISPEGRGYCWGANTHGQLGTSSNLRAGSPTPIGGDLDLTSVAAGLSHSCAIVRTGAIWCWGEDDHGQLGDRSNAATRASPVRVADNHIFRAIVAGASHSCALDAEGMAWCWGAGARGQLGTGATTDVSAPAAVANWRFGALAAGWNFTCGLDTAGRAFCWGANDGGQLGTRDTVDRDLPTPVATDVAFVSIAAGATHACGVTAAGDAYCWGKNTNGQIGDGTINGRPTPVPVKSDAHFTSITAGAMHTCAIDDAGLAHCWGLDAYGQLGDGGNVSRSQPVLVAGGHHFASLRAFGSHTCGTTTSGEAFCWGYNLEGQLGDGTRTNRSRPVYLEPPAGR